MLSMKDTGLVSGVELAKTPLTAVRVLRGFFDESGKARAPGEIVLLNERTARSIIAAGKAERAELPKEEPPAQIEQPPAEPVEAEPEAVAEEPKESKKRRKRDEA